MSTQDTPKVRPVDLFWNDDQIRNANIYHRLEGANVFEMSQRLRDKYFDVLIEMVRQGHDESDVVIQMVILAVQEKLIDEKYLKQLFALTD